MAGNKARAISFLEMASSGKVQEAFDKYIDDEFRHHLIFIKGDRNTFKQAMEDNYRQFPEKKYSTLRALEDGELVAVHGRVQLDAKVFAVIHIFKFQGEKIIESWEASQEELSNQINENGLF